MTFYGMLRGILSGTHVLLAVAACLVCVAGRTEAPDPAWSTYLGGPAFDAVRAAAVDAEGNILVAGYTASAGWTAGGWRTAYHGGTNDGFAAKFSPSGAHLWSTYVGGTGNDQCHGIAVDAAGNVLLTGFSNSTGWTENGWRTAYGGGNNDAFAVKLDPDGGHLWSTYLGGGGADAGYGIAADPAGNVLIAGQTASADWVSGGWKTTYLGGTYDAFIVKLGPGGNHLWSSCLGGTLSDQARGVAVDQSGNVHVTGHTASIGWTSGGWDTSHGGGGSDGFVLKLSASGAHLWSSYLGGADYEEGFGVALDASGNVFAAGNTMSPGWVGNGWDTTHNGNNDAYAVKLSPSGAHLWSTYLGGDQEDFCQAVAVDGEGSLLAMGHTNTGGWTGGGWDTTHNGNYDAYVAKFSPDGAHLWSSYLGGAGQEHGFGVAAAPGGCIYAAGRTDSAGWVGGGWDSSHGGGGDAFLFKIVEGVSVIAISLTPEFWNIGPRPLGHVETSGAFTLANTGNTPVSVAVSAGNAAGGWLLRDTPGVNAFSVEFDRGDDGVFETVLSTLGRLVPETLPAGGSVPFRLRHRAPDADTLGAGAPQDFTVTFRASLDVP